MTPGRGLSGSVCVFLPPTTLLILHDLVAWTGDRRVDVLKFVAIACGGALGALTRYWVESTVTSRLGSRFPYGTLMVNVTACVILGGVLAYLSRHENLSPFWRYLIPVGFIGAYSTFSTFEFESFSLLENGAYFLSCLYLVLSVVLGLTATWVGARLGQIVP
jgi:CrcB protein